VAVESSTLDRLDRALIRGLQVSPRAPFSLLAFTLGTSEQTAARRYRRLHRAGLLRVTAVVRAEGRGETNWIVRIQCRPDGASSLAAALAKRDDVGWVSISGGAAEVVCTVRSRSAEARENLLLQRLPRSATVLGVTTSMTLHAFIAGRPDDWTGFENELTAAQEQQLRNADDTIVEGPLSEDSGGLDAIDFAILDRLVADGRASYAELGAAAGISEGRAARRMHALLQRRMAYLDVDLSPSALGWGVQAQLWMSASPALLNACGEALAALPEVSFAAAVTGPHNLIAAVSCRDHNELYRLLTEQIGTIPGIQNIEVSPRMRVVKEAGTLVEGNRLAT
jgi:DNA-binding Lrp family transcriptional regulator